MADTYLDSLLNAEKTQLETYDKGFDPYREAIEQQKFDLPKQYEMARNQTYTAGRTSAIGNNERLASQGLAGNMYSQPKSGYSESSRVANDVAMQNALNSLSAEQRSAATSLQNVIAQAYAQRATDRANITATSQDRQADYKLQLKNAVAGDLSSIIESGGDVNEYKNYLKNNQVMDDAEFDSFYKMMTGLDLNTATSNKVATYEPDELKTKMKSAGLLDDYGKVKGEVAVKNPTNLAKEVAKTLGRTVLNILFPMGATATTATEAITQRPKLENLSVNAEKAYSPADAKQRFNMPELETTPQNGNIVAVNKDLWKGYVVYYDGYWYELK